MTETGWTAEQIKAALRAGLAEIGVDVAPGSSADNAITRHMAPLRGEHTEPRPSLRLIEGGASCKARR